MLDQNVLVSQDIVQIIDCKSVSTKNEFACTINMIQRSNDNDSITVERNESVAITLV